MSADPYFSQRHFRRGIPRQIETALLAAGFTYGHHHRGSGWSDDPQAYEPPIAGYVISAKGYHPERGYCDWWFVDHAGAGAKEMLPRYLEALNGAGFTCTLTPVRWGAKKHVIEVVAAPEPTDEEQSA